ncbi:MAG: ABC transporter ATP-binding protein [Candidatus Pristimantibacillus lignocellulolyticus]|uniref:ABC transporter ATP-binding protein n=1 Tax=Candidatus Pristimantibacillus lignocellulolyticus TaxID=2994561 RepID=A0A9J6ZFJ2_9BACL|nr:MAG: ABC transporter ATP-binding protein [Candidatus Pristimantibacillus lignocellulolyticus]
MIVMRDIHKVYRNESVEVTALNNVSLHVPAGEYIAIMGSSGSGKSTLMNMIGCLDAPSSGEYILDGEKVDSLSQSQLAKLRNEKIGFVFQSFNLLGRQSILHNVELPMMYAGIDKAKRRERALYLLEKVGLQNRIKHRPSELSGGQRQRVAIARALTMNAPVLLADEPTGNLDTKSSIDVMDLFAQIHAEGTTIVLVTHEKNIADHAERVLWFEDGQLKKDTKNGDLQ